MAIDVMPIQNHPMNPTPEAVAAALALVDSAGLADRNEFNAICEMANYRKLGDPPYAAARILAAEVRRLRPLCEAYADQAGIRMGYDRSKDEAEKMVSEKLNQPS
jgi:hypothetical protein